MKYLHSTISIVQHGSVTIASMKNQCVYIQTHSIYASEKKKKKAFRLLDLSSLPDPGSLCSLHIEAVVMELQWGTKHSPEILSLGRCQESPHLNSDLLEFQNNAVCKSYDFFFFCTLLQNTGKPAKELYYLKIVGCHSSLYSGVYSSMLAVEAKEDSLLSWGFRGKLSQQHGFLKAFMSRASA